MSATGMAKAFMRQTLRADPTYADKLPGGIRFGDAPGKTKYPLLRGINSGGADLSAIGEGVVGGHLFYLLTVVDQADQSDRADAVADWVKARLTDEAAAHAVVGGFVYCRKESSVDTPFWQQGSPFQQVGGVYRFWVDLA